MKTLTYDQYYLSYSGLKLPLKLVSPMKSEEIENRNIYYGVHLDVNGNPISIHKVVYGEIEMQHEYGYSDSGDLKWAEITNIDNEVQRFEFSTSDRVTL